MADDEVSLPKSTLQKAIKDLLPADMRVAGDAVDLLVQCCNEFVHLVSTQVGGPAALPWLWNAGRRRAAARPATTFAL